MSTLSNQTNAAFDAVNRVLERQAVWLVLAASVLAFQAFIIWNHKPWADELQAVMIALEAPDQNTLLAWLRYEGHPPLWYWLLQALGSFTEPRFVLPLAATLCAATTQGAILFASPFARLERLLIALSQFVLFEFLTISRGTTLGVALIVLALVLWRSRWFWLLLAALPLVDFLFGVLSGVLLVLKWREKALWWPGISVWLVASAFAGWSVIPPSDMVNAIDAVQPNSGTALSIETARSWLLKLGSMIVPFQGGIYPQWKAPVVPIAGIGWIIFFALCWFVTRERKWHALLIFGFLGFTLFFSLAIYSLSLRHMMLAPLLLIALQWLARNDNAQPSAAFRVWIAVAAICGVASSLISTHRGFDSADKALAAIEARGLSDKQWIALPEWRIPALSGQSDLEFTRPEQECRFRFVRWDHQSRALTATDAFTAMLERHIAKHGRSYLVSDMKFTGFDSALLTPLETVPAGYDGITYYLYEVGPQASEKPQDIPFCHTLSG